MDSTEQNAPAAPPVIEAPGTPSTPSAASEAPAAAPIVPPVGAAALVLDPVEPTARARFLGMFHHVADSIEEMTAELDAHAKAAAKAGETDVHAALERFATLFGEFRNGLLSAGKTLPPKLETEAAGLAAKAKA